MMVRDLATVEKQLGYSYEMDGAAAGGVPHYQHVCPRCRRALFGLAQGRLWAESRQAQLDQEAASTETS
jgi:hypothetical protein